jgi:mRNA-degrading endonuclease RelE of RelBE toxin-antitoxin system
LERDPLPPGKRVKRLQTPRGALYRLRVGDWRIVYELSGSFIDVLGIVSRAELERFLKSL